jgi:peptidyl-prolyl cis-trans isomerase D
MLQEMRKYAKSWVSSIFLGVLALSFGVWGIADIFKGSTDTSVATVGGTAIAIATFQRDYRNLLRNQPGPTGQPMTPEEARKAGLGPQALQYILSRTAVDNEVRNLGLTTSDAAVTARIQSIPNFNGPLGTFDHTTFLQAIEPLGYNEEGFIARIRDDAARDQLLSATRNGFATPPGYVRALFDFLNEVRAAEYVVVPDSALGAIPAPSDAELTAFEKARPEIYSTPEYRTVTYGEIGPEDVMSQMHATDEQLKAEYELKRSDYEVPEKRDIERISFPDQASAQAARAKIDGGTSFDDLAKARGLKAADVNLGTLVQADLDKAQGPAAFALASGAVSQPVKGTFGWVLLRVTKIAPAVNKTFDDVKADLTKSVLMQLALAKLSDISNAYQDANAGGASLSEAAKKVGMHVVQVPTVDGAGLAADGTAAQVPADPVFFKQLFAAEVGEEGEPFQTSDGHLYVVKVNGTTPPRLKPLDAVRAAVTSAWQKQERDKLLEAKAKALAGEIDKTQSLAGIAAPLGVKVQQSPALQRGMNSDIFSPRLLASLFAAKPGAGVYGPSAKGDSYIVARVTGVAHPPPLLAGDPRYGGFANQIDQQFANDLSESAAMAARAKQGVTINQKNIDSVLGEGS